LLATPDYASRLDWSRVLVFWGDERCVPPDHPDSDYRMARESLLDALPPGMKPRVFRMEAELDPAVAAQRYETLLRREFGEHPPQSFDLLLLGMGEDGHTASLFPGTAPIHEQKRWVVAHYVEKLSAWRLTLTPPFLNLSAQTVFLVSGSAKREMLHQVLYSPYQPDLLPSQVIQPVHGHLTWFVDQDAVAPPQNEVKHTDG
jgi:6-phosphogluconolactonase